MAVSISLTDQLKNYPLARQYRKARRGEAFLLAFYNFEKKLNYKDSPPIDLRTRVGQRSMKNHVLAHAITGLFDYGTSERYDVPLRDIEALDVSMHPEDKHRYYVQVINRIRKYIAITHRNYTNYQLLQTELNSSSRLFSPVQRKTFIALEKLICLAKKMKTGLPLLGNNIACLATQILKKNDSPKYQIYNMLKGFQWYEKITLQAQQSNRPIDDAKNQWDQKTKHLATRFSKLLNGEALPPEEVFATLAELKKMQNEQQFVVANKVKFIAYLAMDLPYEARQFLKKEILQLKDAFLLTNESLDFNLTREGDLGSEDPFKLYRPFPHTLLHQHYHTEYVDADDTPCFWRFSDWLNQLNRADGKPFTLKGHRYLKWSSFPPVTTDSAPTYERLWQLKQEKACEQLNNPGNLS